MIRDWTAACRIGLILAWFLGFAPIAGYAATIEVLWYTYAHPQSKYIATIQELADVVHALPKGSGLRWKLTFFGPDSPAPDFARYNVLVIHSAENGFTGQYFAPLGYVNPKEPRLVPDYAGILKNKAPIAAARGERTFISGADADVHTIWGNTGHAPPHPTRKGGRVNCHPPIRAECWDGALGHLVNAVNWAAGGRGMGIVSLVAGEHPSGQWWAHANSFLRGELEGRIAIWGAGTTRENKPVIPSAAQAYPLNAGLTSKGLSDWGNSFHGGIVGPVPGYVPVVVSTTYPGVALAIATAKFAAAGTGGPAVK